ncbi:hypothetical protein OHA27_38770 [Streptomyces sp. NBC_01619]|uniref:hypothetical protein n=1 Tax=Streptomyces sp. NBC_01619 TaxID=2975901 RepID=UPI00224DCBB7|nr:hypothetical protein [Streptomyces sp. NBC_01619]MCX4516034.1 hypothetical protein [Streptomyces sp. NBC_01619]
MLIAYVDESARRRQGEDVCVYTLAAVLVEAESVLEVRETMQSLRYGKSLLVHSRLERAARRAVLVEAIAQLPVVGIVTVCLHRTDTRSERARRRCLVRLLSELSVRGVDRVVFESRHAQDAADRAVLTGLRKASAVSHTMTVTWALASADAGLWAADCLAGAVSWWLDGQGQYFEVLAPLTTILDVDGDS